MLDLEVSPEEGLQHDHWEFILGMHFSQAVAIVQSQVRVIKYAHVIYNDQNPLSHDLILDLPGDGFRLIFDSTSQRLKLIEIYNLKLVRLKYCGTIFNGAEVIPTVHQIDHCFGATRPGTFDKERSLFALTFRGLSFYFPVDSQFQPHYSHGLGSLRFPGEATPILSRLVIYQGTEQGPDLSAPILPLPTSSSSSFLRGGGAVFCDGCLVLRNPTRTRTLGLRLELFAQSAEDSQLLGGEAAEPIHFQRTILFGESAQSVTSKLGNPSKIYYKSDDKMKIHSKEAHKKVASEKSDYFFNYFTLGIDILFDAGSNLVTKFILHTNFPGHYDFTDYHRSPFTLTLGRSSSPSISSLQGQGQGTKGGGGGGGLFSLDNLNPNPASSAAAVVPVASEELLLLDKVSLGPTQMPPPTAPTGGKKNKKKNNGNGGNNKQQGGGNKGQGQLLATSAPSSTSSSEKSSPPSEEGPLLSISAATTSLPSKGSSPAPSTASSLEIRWDSRWEEVRNFLWSEKGERLKLEKPVVLTRSSASNPFGPSLCYGVQDLIFEVMSNDHLATVTIYNNNPTTLTGEDATLGDKSLLDLSA